MVSQKSKLELYCQKGLTLSRLYVNGSMRSWIHYIELRSENGTQLEHITLAKECAKVITKYFHMILLKETGEYRAEVKSFHEVLVNKLTTKLTGGWSSIMWFETIVSSILLIILIQYVVGN